MDDLVVNRALPDENFWSGKRVFLTGHTGFKGGWLAMWLRRMGAVVAGYALPPPTVPSFAEACGAELMLSHHTGDIRDRAALFRAVEAFSPQIVFHLAAQPLVRDSYARPMETFETNVLGTLNLLAALRAEGNVVAMIVTSDKVYQESETPHPETDPLGGRDPYSASKASAELAVASFPMAPGQVVATLRAGNVIGGGDWARDRLVADFCRAMLAGEALSLRHPASVRPWQHVLDPLCGYLLAAEFCYAHRPARPATWNFGPAADSEVAVQDVAARLCGLWGGGATFKLAPEPERAGRHETAVLRLESSKARDELGWRPGWTLDEALAQTVTWFKAFQRGADMRDVSLAQIEAYLA
jgi:CDP-glucose 4,6-dehydratase